MNYVKKPNRRTIQSARWWANFKCQQIVRICEKLPYAYVMLKTARMTMIHLPKSLPPDSRLRIVVDFIKIIGVCSCDANITTGDGETFTILYRPTRRKRPADLQKWVIRHLNRVFYRHFKMLFVVNMWHFNSVRPFIHCTVVGHKRVNNAVWEAVRIERVRDFARVLDFITQKNIAKALTIFGLLWRNPHIPKDVLMRNWKENEKFCQALMELDITKFFADFNELPMIVPPPLNLFIL